MKLYAITYFKECKSSFILPRRRYLYFTRMLSFKDLTHKEILELIDELNDCILKAICKNMFKM